MAKIRKSSKKFVEADKSAESFEKAPEQVIEITEADMVKEEEPLRLTAEEIKELQLLNFALRCFVAEREVATMRRDELLKIIDPKGALRQFAGTIQHLTSEHNDSMNKMNRLVENIKGRLGVNIKDYTYNEETGYLQKVDGQT